MIDTGMRLLADTALIAAELVVRLGLEAEEADMPMVALQNEI